MAHLLHLARCTLLPPCLCCRYRVASFKAASRVTADGKADAPVTDLSSLTDGGDIIVEDLGEQGLRGLCEPGLCGQCEQAFGQGCAWRQLSACWLATLLCATTLPRC